MNIDINKMDVDNIENNCIELASKFFFYYIVFIIFIKNIYLTISFCIFIPFLSYDKYPPL